MERSLVNHSFCSNFYKEETQKEKSTKNVNLKDKHCFICHQEGEIACNCPHNKDVAPKTSNKAKKYFPKSNT